MSPLVDLFVNESGLRVIKAFTPLSRDEVDAIWDRIGVQVITDWRTGRGSRCKRTPNNDFFYYIVWLSFIYKMGKSWRYIRNDNVNSTEDLLEGIIDICTYIEGGVCQRGIRGFVSGC